MVEVIQSFKVMGQMAVKIVTNFLPAIPVAISIVALDVLISKQKKGDMKVSYTRTPEKEGI